MDRSLYPDGVTVGAVQLQNTETSKAFHIQRRFADTTRAGRASGLSVVIGTPTSRFTIGAGYGYTPRGDYVESPGTVNLALADYTSGVENLIVLVYRENLDQAEAHEDGGATRNTIASRSSELKVVTRDEYNGMPASADGDFATNLNVADLTTDAQDRLVIVASVLGKGFSGVTPIGYLVGDFTNGNITQQPLFPVILSAALPSAPTITGMNIKAISANTFVGQGILQLNGASGAYRLSWASPKSDGTSVAPDGTHGVTFGNSATIQTFTILTDPHTPTDATADASTITVEVLTDLMPASGTPFDDDVTVAHYYDDTGAAFSARDELHRSKLGSYVPTPKDAHGMGFPDFDQQMAVIPQPLVVGTGVLASNVQALESRISTPRSTVGGVARTLMWQMTGGTYVIRFYKNAFDEMEVVTNARFDGTNWVKDTTAAGTLATKLTLWSNGMFESVYDQATSPFSDSGWKQTWASDAFDIPGNGLMRLGEGFMGSATDTVNPRIKTRYNTASRTAIWASTDFAGGSLSGLRIYASEGLLELVVNGIWNGTVWAKDNTSALSLRISLDDSADISTNYRIAGGGTWADNAWTDSPNSNILAAAATGELVLAGSLEAGRQVISGVLASGNDLLARFSGTIDPSGPAKRFLISEIATPGGVFWRKYLTFPTGSPYAHTEETLNCLWTGTQWSYDSVPFGSATLWRYGFPYTFVATKNASGSSPWADLPASVLDVTGPHAGGFDRIEYGFGHNGGGLYLRPQNPVGTPQVNTLYADTIAKAWGTITVTNVSTTPIFTLTDSFNIDLLSPSGTNLVVSFLQNMGSTAYAVKANLAFLPTSLSDSNTIVDVRPHTKSASSFDFSLITRSGALASMTGFDVENNGLIIDFSVHGKQ